MCEHQQRHKERKIKFLIESLQSETFLIQLSQAL